MEGAQVRQEVCFTPGVQRTETAMPRIRRVVAADPALDDDAQREAAAAISILVVDDDDLVRSGVVRSLTRLNYRVLSVASPAEALALLRSDNQRIDLLLTDIRMPGAMDGIELARVVRQEFPRIAILLTTGFAGWEATAADERILYKPYRLAELAAAVRESLAAASRRSA
jgi:CheY-like chemotaxis protein